LLGIRRVTNSNHPTLTVQGTVRRFQSFFQHLNFTAVTYSMSEKPS
jgi:hypothetical protein